MREFTPWAGRLPKHSKAFSQMGDHADGQVDEPAGEQVDVERLDRFVNGLWARRSRLDEAYQQIARYVFPERACFGNEPAMGSAGEEREDIYDSTPEDANAMLAAALHALLTNPAGAWFTLDVEGSEEADKDEGQWLASVQHLMMDVFNDPGTGFNNEVSSLYQDLGPFGWGVFYSEEQPEGGVRFASVPLYECAMAENVLGRVDILARRTRMQAAHVVECFASTGPELREQAVQDPLAMVDVVHVVLPAGRVPELAPPGPVQRADMPGLPPFAYASIYYAGKDRSVLHVGWFHEFPYQVPRWSKASGEWYGRGPGWAALPDIRVLNAVSASQLMAAEKQSDPPLLVPNDAVLGKIQVFAGGITYYDPQRGGGQIMPLPMAVDLGTMQSIREEKQEAIRRAFLNDRILLAGGPQMTATEVTTRENKQMLVLGPVLGRMQSEFLGPLVERVFQMLLRQGLFAPMPESLRHKRVRVRYVSPIARAQKQWDATAFQQAMGYLAPVLQAAPLCADNFDPDAIARDTQVLFGYPAKYLRAPAQVASLRDMRQTAVPAGVQTTAQEAHESA